ncbi:sugar ABC transporter permease [Nakamurella antarctica]|uniref:Sugar ABC transporter permease n=1 Tax=Nakamurella antarctica TaxID=1902245 RepID=A0A3G8ZVD5_9ACTN|nr:sugar ABC transporter permease [Nakamurella antarctica]AZI58434.1 sugar ABC transporter permease [Nakamurella antarctica]
MAIQIRRSSRGVKETSRWEWLFILPLLVGITLVFIAPSFEAIAKSFTRWDPGYDSPFVGLENYQDALTDPSFRTIIFNQFYFLLAVPLWTFLPLFFAAVLRKGVSRPAIFRSILFFPSIVSAAVMGLLFVQILAPLGPLNEALRAIGLDSLTRGWLVDSSTVKPVIVAVIAWATLGTGVVIFSAALSAAPPDLFEAAELDGAGFWAQFRYVIIPTLKPTIQVWAAILFITVFVSMFPWIYTLTRGGPGDSSGTLDFRIYESALVFGNFGIAAAQMVIMLVIVVVLGVVGALGGQGWQRRRNR